MYHHIGDLAYHHSDNLTKLAVNHRKLLADLDAQAEQAVNLAVILANRVRELEAENELLRKQLLKEDR